MLDLLQRLKLNSFQMATMPPEELCYLKQEIGGETYALVYGSKVNRELVTTLGEEVMMIPRICVEMQPFQRRILHEKDGWTKRDWPFLTMSTKAKAAVVPFNHDGHGRFEDMVFVFPKGFMCTQFLPDWPKRVEILKEAGVNLETRRYDDCDHALVQGLNIVTMAGLIAYFLGTSCPVIVTLSQKT